MRVIGDQLLLILALTDNIVEVLGHFLEVPDWHTPLRQILFTFLRTLLNVDILA